MRKRSIGLALMSLAFVLPATASAAIKPAAAAPAKVLVVTSTEDALSTAGVAAIRSAASSGDFTVTAPAPAAVGAEFTPEGLDQYRAVVFLNTGIASPLTDVQRTNFANYYRKGGGFVGIGSAVETDPAWSFLTDVLGTRSSGRTAVQSGTVKVFDRVHDATKNLPEYWDRTDNWYNFATNVRGLSHVLATVVEDPFGPQPQGATLDGIAGGTMGANHPISFCKDYQGGRSFYTGLGNTPESFDASLTTHLKGAINWAAGQSDPVYSDCGATVLKNFQQTKVSAPPNLNEPVGFDQLPDGRIIQTARRGSVRLHDPVKGTTQIIADFADSTLPLTQQIYTNSEDGLYGPAIDNNFAQNKWVYLYYSPQKVTNVKLSDGTIVDQITPNTTPPLAAASPKAWDPYIGYFQLSRFKFVDDAPGAPAHLDMTSEQQILRVPNNRQACCHVAGDIDFDTHNNLWFVTGDDSAAGTGDAGAWGQSIDQKWDDTQTLRVTATGGTFTLTLGQGTPATTAPIAYNATAAQIQSALEALPNAGVGNVQVTGTGTVASANQTVLFKGIYEEKDVAQLTSNASGLTGAGATPVAIVTTREGGWFRFPTADSARTALNTNDLRGKINRIHVNDASITPAQANTADYTGTGGGAYTIPSGNLFPMSAGQPMAKTRAEVYAMGFRNPFRLQVDENDVAYVSDYSPDSQTPQQFHGPAGVGRYEIVRHPANYGWPYCFKSDLPEYPWNVNLQVPMDALTHQPVPAGQTPQPYSCGGPTVPNNDYWNTNGGPGNEPGLTQTPALADPDIWSSYRDNNVTTPLGTPCFAEYGPNALTLPNATGSNTPCPRLFPELYAGGVGPHGIAKYKFDPNNPSTTKFPAYYDNSVILGEFTQDTLREVKLDSQNRVFKVNGFLDCGAANVASTPFDFECDNPMDMQWGKDGSFYLLTYGDGFFAINLDAGMYRWDYVKGAQAPKAILTTDKTDGALPLTVQFTGSNSSDRDQGDSIRFEWDFGDGSPISTEPNPTHTYTKAGRYTAILSVIDSSGKRTSTSTVITAGNTSPTVVVNAPLDGATFAFGDTIQYKVTVTDPEDPTINCNDINVTFVLGHDTHGHAEQSTTGCTGFLQTDAADVAHGGNVFGVISASYTDKGGQGANSAAPSLMTTSQVQIRQKHQEVEFVVNQSGTATAANTDGGTGVHRSSLAAGDWIQLNGPFNLLQIDSVTFRVADAVAGRPVGSPLAAIEIHQDSITGPILTTANLVSTGDIAAWSSQRFPIAMTGKHELFFVFRAVTGGQTGNNLFNLNWAEFGGNGITVVKTNSPGDVGGSVPATLSLSLGAPATFGNFIPGIARPYDAGTTANVISTAGDATLSVADPSSNATGHLVNGTFSLPSALTAKGSSTKATGGAFAPVGGSSSPTTLLTYGGPVSNDTATISFQQAIGANDALRTGAYSKTLTFTLSTTTP
jgi:PKD repeat protein